jgi:SAM-dependent methyltransferase
MEISCLERCAAKMNETKFNGMGKIYNQFRSSYPKELLDYLYSDLHFNECSVIVDVGSGTGKMAQLLLEKGSKVYAVEPNGDMRTIAEQNLKSFDGFVSVNGSAENTGLKEDSVDFIMAAQAFHWFDRQRFREECRRILKPGGMVVLVYNSRDEDSEQVRENFQINKKYCPDFKGFSGGMDKGKIKNEFGAFFCGEIEKREFINDLLLDEQGFIGRNLSASYAPKESDRNFLPYIGELKELFHKYSKDKILILPNFTQSYAGKIR